MTRGDAIDLDALLDAQSSDEDDEHLPELGRSIEEILKDAEADADAADEEVKEIAAVQAPEIRFRDAEGELKQDGISQGRTRLQSATKFSKIWEAPVYQVTPRPSPRPGAALAAAAAASRSQLVSPRQNLLPVRQDSEIVADTRESKQHDEETSSKNETDGSHELQNGFNSHESIDKGWEPPSLVAEAEDFGKSETVSSEEFSLIVSNDEEAFPPQEHEIDEEVLVSEASSSDISDFVEEIPDQHDMVDEASSSSDEKVVEVDAVVTSSLDAAEEVEKRAANSGLHLEEGAAAQPMQLEGIQRGPPAIGLLQLDWGGPLSFALSSIAILRDHGNPRALAIHSNYIAVGMSKGSVLLSASKYSATSTADDNETKVLFLSNAADKSHASVSVLCFSKMWDLLLVGYLNGSVALWDVTKAALVKTVTGEHQNVIVHAAFIVQDASSGRQLKAITADCKGVVLLHTFTLVPLLRRYSVTTQCLLDGQRTGVVLSLSPLVLNGTLINSLGSVVPAANDAGRKFLYDGSSSEEVGGLVVFVTQHIVLVFRLVPALEVFAKLVRPEGVREGSIPYTSWRGSKSADKDSSAEDSDSNYPLLALAWGRKVFVLQLQKTELRTLAEWGIDSKATGIAWLGEEMLVIATAKAELFLFTKEGIELEHAAIRGEDGHADALTFHTHFLETCNNPEKVYANSIGVRGAAFYILGASRLWRARLLPWQDRIKALQDAGDWMGAFQIAMELYDGRARGVTGLPSGLSAMQVAIMPNLLALLSSYIDEAFAYVRLALGVPEEEEEEEEEEEDEEIGTSNQVAREEQYARVGRVAIEFCVHISRTDVLFENVFRKFAAVDQAATFLELLEPYILKDMLCGLAPEIMQSLVEHYSSKGWLQRVEQCILHMDISSLDFNQVMRLCRDHGLFSALIYLFNKGLNDFRSPLDELLVAAQDQRRDNAQAFGYKLLVYLKYCFSGLAFPPGRGFLPSTQLPQLKAQLLEYLLDPAGSGLESAYAVFPRLHYLLNLDVVATLEVLNLALGKEEAGRTFTDDDLIQQTIDALVHIVETVLCVDTVFKSTTDHILQFIAHFVSVRGACVPPTTLHRILDLFLDKDTQQSDREDLTVLLLKAVPGKDWDPDHVLELAEKSHFWRVSALVYARKEDYVSALKSHLNDLSRPYLTFYYVISMLDPENSLKRELSEFREAVFSCIPQLVELDRIATLYVVLEYFSDQVDRVIQSLDPIPQAMFGFLKAVLEVQSYSGSVRDSEAETVIDHPWKDRSRLVSLLDVSHVEITDEMVELYIELLCRFDCQKVLDFLQSFENYRLEKCLKLCQKYGVKDGAAFLLERVGDVGSALTLILSDLTRLFHELDTAVAANSSSSMEEKLLHSVKDAAVSLCQRNTFRLDPQEAESLWFHLLDRFIHPLQALTHDDFLRRSVKERASHYEWKVLIVDGALSVLRKILSKLAEEVVTGMIGYVPLQVVLNKIVSDHGNYELGDFRAAILEMLSAYGYEVAILGAARRIIKADMFRNVEALKRGRSCGIGPRSLRCCVCKSKLTQETEGKGFQVFSCGHLMHLDCVEESATEKTVSNHLSFRCPVCVQHQVLETAAATSSMSDLFITTNSHTTQPQQQPPPKQATNEFGLSAVSRFEVLKILQRGEALPDMNAELLLELSPPVIYKRKALNRRSTSNNTKTSMFRPLQKNRR